MGESQLTKEQQLIERRWAERKTSGPIIHETNQWQVKLIRTITLEEKQDRGWEETQHGTRGGSFKRSSSSKHVQTGQMTCYQNKKKQQLLACWHFPLKQRSWSLACLWRWRTPCNSTVLASVLMLSPPLRRTTSPQSGSGPLSKKKKKLPEAEIIQ